MLLHAQYEQRTILNDKVMHDAEMADDVKNFQEAQDANQERKARWTLQSQPEQVSFSRECVAPGAGDNPHYFKTPPGQFTDNDQRWDMAVPVLNKYDELMQGNPEEMNQVIKGIGDDMDSGNLPNYDIPWYLIR
jgi:hypothetical protein